MGALILFLLITVVLFGAGFAMRVLWWVALALAVVWLIGLFARAPDRRWYRW